jgi:hypothetical protein
MKTLASRSSTKSRVFARLRVLRDSLLCRLLAGVDGLTSLTKWRELPAFVGGGGEKEQDAPSTLPQAARRAVPAFVCSILRSLALTGREEMALGCFSPMKLARLNSPRQITNTAVIPFARVTARLARLACAVGICLSCVFSGITASACGFENHLPSSGFLDESFKDYRMILWERLGGAKFDETQKTEIPIHLSFTPILGHQGSPILGQGFLLMPFDATFLQKGSNGYEMTQPSGVITRLRKKRNSDLWGGNSWLVKIDGTGARQIATAQSSCGWTLTYTAGRLTQMTSPSKEIFDFSTDNQGLRQVNRNGRKLITLRRDFDPKTTLPIWHLDFISEEGPKHAVLKMGHRPILVTLPDKRTREEGRRSLASIQFDNEPERRYDFKIDALTIHNTPPKFYSPTNERKKTRPYIWEATTKILKRFDDCEYSFVKILGAKCLKTTWDDGTYSIEGDGPDIEDLIVKGRHSKDLFRIKRFRSACPLFGKMKERYILDENHRQTLVEKCEYNEHGHVVRHEVNEEIITYSPTLEMSKYAKTGKIRWLKRFDENRKIIEFQTETNKYLFTPQGEMTIMTITDCEHGKVIDKVTLPTAEIQKTFLPN